MATKTGNNAAASLRGKEAAGLHAGLSVGTVCASAFAHCAFVASLTPASTVAGLALHSSSALRVLFHVAK
jgi:hypothetical protein